MNCYFDIETDGLLDRLSTMHSLVVKDSTGRLLSCTNNSDKFTGLETGIAALKYSDNIIGHNIIGFDIPALVKLDYPNLMDKAIDTLVLSRLIFPEMLARDTARREHTRTGLPKKMYGHHSLKSWGYRLGILKGDFGEETDWENWSEDMQYYCEQDVAVTEKLYLYLMEQQPAQEAVILEHEVQKIMTLQERLGIPFDYNAAMAIKIPIEQRLDSIRTLLQQQIAPHRKYRTLIPKRDNKTRGYVKGVPVQLFKETPFNPNSRKQIEHYLKTEHNWIPTEFTDKGNPKISGSMLKEMGTVEPTIKIMAEYLEAAKLASQLYGGDKAWLNYVTESGRIHGRVITNGAMTGRATHSSPNLAQVPSPRAFMGKECRMLFYAPDGKLIVGADASGLELRMLAHYLYPYDGGAYARVILEGDIHTHNQEAAGLPTRDIAKTFIYAMLYGAGADKLGAMLIPMGTPEQKRIAGRQAMDKFVKSVPAYRVLKDKVMHKFKTQGYLRGLDGRILTPRSAHSALNTLLQGAGAIVCKQWIVETWIAIRSNGLEQYVSPALWVHDEQQLIVDRAKANEVGSLMVRAIQETGTKMNINMPLDGEAKQGRTWYDTH